MTWLIHLRALLALAAGLACAAAGAAGRLASYDADRAQTTVSGISSGGYMAVQFHLAHSSTVKGVGAVAAGPYYCAQNSAWTAYYNCMTPRTFTPLPRTDLLVADAQRFAARGAIDPLANVASAKVWLFTGTKDETLLPEVVRGLEAFYRALKVPDANLALVADQPAGHGMVSADPDVTQKCGVTGPPFLNRCIDPKTAEPYDAPRAILEHFYGPLAPAGTEDASRLVPFAQDELAGGDAYAIGMGPIGYAYVPKACAADRCRVHVAFHGCRQSADTIGLRFVRDAGYNRWAETNRIIVLYPQTTPRNGWGVSGTWRWTYVFNPRGCWDWWGYTDSRYATRDGAQIRAVSAMVERLASPRSP